MKSTATANAVLDRLLGLQAWTPASTYYLALYTTAPTEAGGGVEVTGDTYARVAITNGLTAFPAAVGGSKANGVAFTFAQPGALWGDIVAWGLHSHITNDALVIWGSLDDPVTVDDTSAPPSFAPGDLQFAET